MEIGLVGLGKMGGNMRTRLRNKGHTVVGYDRDPDLTDVGSLAELVEQLLLTAGGVGDGSGRRLPPGRRSPRSPTCSPTATSSSTAATASGPTTAHAALLAEHGVGFVDCGVSGGVWGLENGYALMCGGSDAATSRRSSPPSTRLKPDGDSGFVHAGREPGAGHFAKMVHNGIEYAMMQSYAEGWELLRGHRPRRERHRGLRLLARGHRDPVLAARPARRRRWQRTPGSTRSAAGPTTPARAAGRCRRAIDHAVPMNAIAAALFARFASRQDDSPAMKAIAAMRNQFGGHALHTEPAPRRRLAGHPTGPAAEPVHLAHLSLHDFRCYADLELALEPGRHRARGPQRAGEDQRRRGGRLPLAAQLAPGRPGRARWCAAAPSRRWSAQPWSEDGRRAVLEVEINPGRVNRARVNRARCPRPATWSASSARCCSPPRTWPLVKGDPAERRRFLDDLLVLRRTALRRHQRRLRPGAEAAQLAAQERRRRATSRLHRLGAVHARGLGRQPGSARRGDPGRAGGAGRGARPARRQGLRGGRAGGRPGGRGARLPAELRPPVPSRDRDPHGDLEPALLAAVARVVRDELDRGVTLVGPHRDDLLLPSATSRSRAMPATASRGRSRWRCGWPPTT